MKTLGKAFGLLALASTLLTVILVRSASAPPPSGCDPTVTYTLTDVLGLQQLGFRQCNWHLSVNASLQILNDIASDTGDLTSRPSCTSGRISKLYFVDDCQTTACGSGLGSVHCATRCNGSSWDVVVCDQAAGSSSPGAPQYSIQFNNPLGSFDGDSNFVINPTTYAVTGGSYSATTCDYTSNLCWIDIEKNLDHPADPSSNIGRLYFVGSSTNPTLYFRGSSGTAHQVLTDPLTDDYAMFYITGANAFDTTENCTSDGSGCLLWNPLGSLTARSCSSSGSANAALYLEKYPDCDDTPDAVVADEDIGEIYIRGWDSSALATGAIFRCEASENWSGSAHGTKCSFFLKPTGSTSLLDRYIIDGNGDTQIGSDDVTVGYQTLSGDVKLIFASDLGTDPYLFLDYSDQRIETSGNFAVDGTLLSTGAATFSSTADITGKTTILDDLAVGNASQASADFYVDVSEGYWSTAGRSSELTCSSPTYYSIYYDTNAQTWRACEDGGTVDLTTTSGTMTDWYLGASSGPAQQVQDGETATILGGSNINTTAAADRQVTVALDSEIEVAVEDMGGAVFHVEAYGADCTDSSDDSSYIQAAENAADDVCGTVLLPAGDCKIDDSIVVSECVTIAGVGPGSIVSSTSNLASENFFINETTDPATANDRDFDITFRDFSIVGTTNGCSPPGSPCHAIALLAVDRAVVQNVVMIDIPGDCVYLASNSSDKSIRGIRNKIIDNTCYNAERQGIAVTGAEQLLIANNHIQDVYFSGIDLEEEGETAHVIQGVVIANNVIKDCDRSTATCGISITGDNALQTLADVVVDGNRIYDPGRGICFRHTTNLNLTDNLIVSSSDVGIKCVETSGNAPVGTNIVGNIVVDSATHGFDWQDRTTSFNLSGNQFYGSGAGGAGHGIRVDDAVGANISGNLVDDVGASSSDCVAIADTTDVSVTGNTLINCDRYGVHIGYTATSGTSVTGNAIGVTSAGNACITDTGSSGTTGTFVTGNSLSTCTTGVDLSAGTNAVALHRNTDDLEIFADEIILSDADPRITFNLDTGTDPILSASNYLLKITNAAFSTKGAYSETVPGILVEDTDPDPVTKKLVLTTRGGSSDDVVIGSSTEVPVRIWAYSGTGIMISTARDVAMTEGATDPVAGVRLLLEDDGTVTQRLVADSVSDDGIAKIEFYEDAQLIAQIAAYDEDDPGGEVKRLLIQANVGDGSTPLDLVLQAGGNSTREITIDGDTGVVTIDQDLMISDGNELVLDEPSGSEYISQRADSGGVTTSVVIEWDEDLSGCTDTESIEVKSVAGSDPVIVTLDCETDDGGGDFMTNWTLQADAGTPEVISDNETVVIAGADGLGTLNVGSSLSIVVDKEEFDLQTHPTDCTGLSADNGEPCFEQDADTLYIYDSSWMKIGPYDLNVAGDTDSQIITDAETLTIGGDGVTISTDATTANKITITCNEATTTTLGCASFATLDFGVDGAGEVTIDDKFVKLAGDTDVGILQFSDTSQIRPDDAAGEYLSFTARDVDGAVWTEFMRLTSNDTPTLAFVSAEPITFAGNLVLDDEKNLELREEDAGGDNYVRHKAPAALTNDTTFVWFDGNATCDAGEVIEVVSNAGGVVTLECDTDSTGAGSGDNVQVNGVDIDTTANFIADDVEWTRTPGSPDTISGNVIRIDEDNDGNPEVSADGTYVVIDPSSDGGLTLSMLETAGISFGLNFFNADNDTIVSIINSDDTHVADLSVEGDLILWGNVSCTGCVDSTDIQNNTILSEDITNNTITGGAVGDIALSTITSDNLANNSVTADQISTGAVGSSDIADGTIAEEDLEIDALDTPNDEDILTYETTGTKFEWHTPAELITAGDYLGWTGTTLNVEVEAVEETVCHTIIDPDTNDNYLWFRANRALTITSVDCATEDTGNTTVQAEECSSGIATGTDDCGVLESVVCDADGADDGGGFTDSSIAAGNWVRIEVTAVTPTPRHVTFCLTYTKDD